MIGGSVVEIAEETHDTVTHMECTGPNIPIKDGDGVPTVVQRAKSLPAAARVAAEARVGCPAQWQWVKGSAVEFPSWRGG